MGTCCSKPKKQTTPPPSPLLPNPLVASTPTVALQETDERPSSEGAALPTEHETEAASEYVSEDELAPIFSSPDFNETDSDPETPETQEQPTPTRTSFQFKRKKIYKPTVAARTDLAFRKIFPEKAEETPAPEASFTARLFIEKGCASSYTRSQPIDSYLTNFVGDTSWLIPVSPHYKRTSITLDELIPPELQERHKRQMEALLNSKTQIKSQLQDMLNMLNRTLSIRKPHLDNEINEQVSVKLTFTYLPEASDSNKAFYCFNVRLEKQAPTQKLTSTPQVLFPLTKKSSGGQSPSVSFLQPPKT